MSARLFADDILFFQRLLKAEDLYSGELDGIWGPLTEQGACEFEELSNRIQQETAIFDFRTEKNIRTLALKAQKEARIFMDKVLRADINAKIISGTRTYAEQNRLFRQGRYGNPGPIVTCVRGGGSSHNFGIAWDIGIFTKTGGYCTEGEEYDKAAAIGKTAAIEWGGDWLRFVDKPHYQLKMNITLAMLREQFETGEHFTMIA